jgi:hypothetical protein
MNDTIFYFGCWSQSAKGHYLFRAEERSPISYFKIDSLSIPDELKEFLKKIDGYTPSSAQQSKGKLQQIAGWTILTLGDYSADTRPGSSAAIIAYGNLSLIEILTLARKTFPLQMARIEKAALISI